MELRDLLKAQAQARGRTIGEHLQALAAFEARDQRFEKLRQAMEANPPDAEYERELREWQGDQWT